MIPQNAFEKSMALFLEPIASLLEDGSVSEILINGPAEVWIEKHGVLSRTSHVFPCSNSLNAALNNVSQFSGRPFNLEHPILEARLPDGSRLEAVMPPIAHNGPAVSIRRFSTSRLTVNDLVKNNSLSSSAAMFLARAISKKANLLISGGTGTGKTSLLQALAGFFLDGERIVVLEDTHEIELSKPHVVYLESRAADEKGRGRIGIRELLHATLRLRPDRIVVGEIRGSEALDMLQAVTSGHGGSMTTVHANSPRDALMRIETMALMASEDLPLPALRSQVVSAMDLVVQIERNTSGRRRVTKISGVHKKLVDGNYQLRPLYVENNAGILEKWETQKAHEAAAS